MNIGSIIYCQFFGFCDSITHHKEIRFERRGFNRNQDNQNSM